MTTIRDTTKVPKSDANEHIEELNSLDGVEAEQRTTDEFDIPPTAILDVKAGLEALR